MVIRGKMLHVAALLVSVAFLSGCPQSDEQKRLEAEHQATILKYNEENQRLALAAEAAERKAADLERLLAVRDKQISLLKDEMGHLGGSRLDRKVEAQLQSLAAELGGKLVGNRLELPSDYFFASGKYDLRDNARASLRQLATLLKDKNLMLAIVGHTDSDKISNPALKKLGVYTNRHLSLLRALSVLDELKKDGYPEMLMYPTGWGDLRRINTSDTKDGKAENRRVDIYIDPAGSSFFGITAIDTITPASSDTDGPVIAK